MTLHGPERSTPLLALTLVMPLACGGDDRSATEQGDQIVPDDDDDDVDDDDNGGKLDAGEGPGDDDDNGDPEGDDCECETDRDLIYVLSDNAELWSYAPQTNVFNRLGTFDCGTDPNTFSMGVGRDGIAWVMFMPGGEIYRVDVNNANACYESDYDASANPNFRLFGMAFVSESKENQCDKLYAHTFDGSGWSQGNDVGKLGVMEPDDLTVSTIANIDYNGGELTGTGDGRLFAFAGTPSAELIEYDKDDGSVVDITGLSGLQLTNAFAFGFWGGDFYFFTEEDGLIPTASKVTKLDYDESDGNGQALTVVHDKAPIRIVGAGVSTCAPVGPVE